MTSVEFHRLLQIGCWREIPNEAILTIEGKPGPELFFIAEGSARVLLDNKLLAILHPDAIVGEKSFMSDGNASATVVAETPLTAFVLDKLALRALMRRDHGVETAILKAIGRGLATKLRAAHGEPSGPHHGGFERELMLGTRRSASSG